MPKRRSPKASRPEPRSNANIHNNATLSSTIDSKIENTKANEIKLPQSSIPLREESKLTNEIRLSPGRVDEVPNIKLHPNQPSQVVPNRVAASLQSSTRTTLSPKSSPATHRRSLSVGAAALLTNNVSPGSPKGNSSGGTSVLQEQRVRGQSPASLVVLGNVQQLLSEDGSLTPKMRAASNQGNVTPDSLRAGRFDRSPLHMAILRQSSPLRPMSVASEKTATESVYRTPPDASSSDVDSVVDAEDEAHSQATVLVSALASLTGDELMRLVDVIRSLMKHCQSATQEHHDEVRNQVIQTNNLPAMGSSSPWLWRSKKEASYTASSTSTPVPSVQDGTPRKGANNRLYALNCQNLYEVDRAMRRQASVIHIRPQCRALRRQSRRLGSTLRRLESSTLWLGLCTLIAWTAYHRFWRSRRGDIMPASSWLTTLHAVWLHRLNGDKTSSPISFSRLFLHFMGRYVPLLACTAAGLSTLFGAWQHWTLSKSSRWRLAVDYTYVAVKRDGTFLHDNIDSEPSSWWQKLTSFFHSRRDTGFALDYDDNVDVFLVRNDMLPAPNVSVSNGLPRAPHLVIQRSHLQRPIYALAFLVAYTCGGNRLLFGLSKLVFSGPQAVDDEDFDGSLYGLEANGSSTAPKSISVTSASLDSFVADV